MKSPIKSPAKRVLSKTAASKKKKVSTAVSSSQLAEIKDLVGQLLISSSDRNDSTKSIGDSVDKLTNIVVELKSLQSLSAQTMVQQEKRIDILTSSFESYKSATSEDMIELERSTHKQISEIRENVSEQLINITTKIDHLQKYIWMAVGGVSAATWIIMALLYWFGLSHA